MKSKAAVFLLVMASLASVLSCSGRKESLYRKTKPLMDTVVSITVAAGSRDRAESAIEKTFSEISRFGELVNFYSEEGDLAEINRNAGIRPAKVSADTLKLISRAIFTSEKSGGAFDPTIGPIVRLWDFHNRKRPTAPEIRNALPLVNYRDIIIDSSASSVFLRRKGMMLDLGGIAKGYAADLAVEVLKKEGIGSGLVAIAGDIRTFGPKPDGSAWTIGIKNPRQTSDKDEIMATIGLNDRAISTAGDYERSFIEDGRRYHHILDPGTGYPADACRSVSVVSDKGVVSDGFDNAVFVLGPERGLRLASEMGLEVLIIDRDGKFHMTDKIREKVKLEKGH